MLYWIYYDYEGMYTVVGVMHSSNRLKVYFLL